LVDGTTIDRDVVTVYLRRGRVLLAVYFVDPTASLSVDGRTKIGEIVALFESRLAELPSSVTDK
jgi:hypothetical protein